MRPYVRYGTISKTTECFIMKNLPALLRIAAGIMILIKFDSPLTQWHLYQNLHFLWICVMLLEFCFVRIKRNMQFHLACFGAFENIMQRSSRWELRLPTLKLRYENIYK